MFDTDSMPCAHDAALEKRESGFYGVSVNVTLDVNPTAVLDGLMSRSRNARPFHCEGIRDEVVRDNHVHILADILSNVARNRSSFHIAGMKHADITVTLADTDYDFLVRSTSLESFAPSLAPDIGFIHFHLAAQLRPASFEHGCANAMAEIPCRFVCLDSERALNLARAHAFLGFAEKDGGEEPYSQRQMRVVEDRVHGRAELVFA